MNETEDDFSLTPTDLDRLRLEQLDQSQKEGRVESENTVWVALRYDTSPMKNLSWKWCSWSLIVNCPGVPSIGAPYEFKNLAALLTFLDQLEEERKEGRSRSE